ncbi:CPBP family intramembrane glutamic endopeptidase [Allomuricauda sp. SCSIO 65647]|uniref:CPBP family intramembrane glutamic endopeptidase n=1 Tax=Allomuricauda sp. SCSIO 65647 TaxID=2908843 RepID=UPI003918BCE2
MGVEEVFDYNPIQKNPISEINNKWVFFILIALIAPVLETLIFQIFLIRGCFVFLYLLFGKRLSEVKTLWVSIIFSAIVFGLFHFFDLTYIIIMVFLGLFWGIVYYYSEKRSFSSFITISILHSLYNITIVAIEEFKSVFNFL